MSSLGFTSTRAGALKCLAKGHSHEKTSLDEIPSVNNLSKSFESVAGVAFTRNRRTDRRQDGRTDREDNANIRHPPAAYKTITIN